MQRSRELLPSLLPVLCRPAEAQAFWGKPGGWTGQASCCPTLSHPKMFLQSDIRDKEQILNYSLAKLLAREVFLLIKGLEPHSLFLASFLLVLLSLCSSYMLSFPSNFIPALSASTRSLCLLGSWWVRSGAFSGQLASDLTLLSGS